MIVIKLSGGLGNQMFQYAAGKALAEKFKKHLYIDTSSFRQNIPNVAQRNFALHIFPNIRPKFVSQYQSAGFYQPGRMDNRLRKFLGFSQKNVFTEKKHAYNAEINEVKLPVLLDGYFQTEKYFEQCSGLVSRQFQFRDLPADDVNREVLKKIEETISVSVHIRRGDYVKYAPTNSFHGVCSKEYYLNAIQYFIERIPNCFFYFFSDDPDWVKENLLNKEMNAEIVRNNAGENSWKDMLLMSRCKHHIIANSSFSWWGAWLNNDENKKVIAPAKWFRSNDPFYEPNDVIPQRWIKMDNQ